jgi:hypothetical protein
MGSDYAMFEREVWEKNILELTELMKTFFIQCDKDLLFVGEKAQIRSKK